MSNLQKSIAQAAAEAARRNALPASTYVRYVDPGHSWVAVRRTDLYCLGLSARDFTTCSHVSADGSKLYLEEDCDAPKFIDAYVARFGREPTLTETYMPNSGNFIRRMGRNVFGQWNPFAR